ncbi:patatin-like phospholipase family protein [Candidatus Odyssella acanthamoebae]|uniref:PNPLA domain-containing protein n=1 Tax=Candidatus Odyssella acanthamoebae TaxID=91604 RepID=A0A077ATC4_9PROT|nr:patatin-like phospholipase family protein [Candidatus Paracaedibacter acanthamoebae]AIK95641.1 hypothetical protein ID47_01115 [Candidatus Paracaedibacter acanthamoebae]
MFRSKNLIHNLKGFRYPSVFFATIGLVSNVTMAMEPDISASGRALTAGDISTLPEDETQYVPSESARGDFLREENLTLDHARRHAYIQIDLEPKFGLAIDGGGMRGLMPALWLKSLHERLEDEGYNRLSRVFDYVGGTSIGGILALGIGSDLEPDTMVDLFENRGPEIFPTTGQWSVTLRSLGGFIGAKYDPSRLETLLQEKFENSTFDEMSTSVLVTSCTTGGRPKLFKNRTDEDQAHRVWEIARCTSAAPTFFPAYRLTTHTDAFVDGGMWVNNPATLVTASMVKELHNGVFSPGDLYLLSLGTGDESLPSILPDNAGAINAKQIIEVIMNSNSQGNHETMQSFLGEENYYRVNPFLDRKIDMDRTDPRAIDDLQGYAEQEGMQEQINRFTDKFLEVKRR